MVDPVYTVGPVITFLSERVGQIVDRIMVSGTDSLVAGAQQDNQEYKKEELFHHCKLKTK